MKIVETVKVVVAVIAFLAPAGGAYVASRVENTEQNSSIKVHSDKITELENTVKNIPAILEQKLEKIENKIDRQSEQINKVDRNLVRLEEKINK